MTDTIDGLKQRLVGAFVILSLAIIFLPMIFDKPHDVSRTTIVEVPPKPDFKAVEEKPAVRPEFERIDLDPADKRVKPLSQIKEEQGSGASALVGEPASSPVSESTPEPATDKPTVSHLPAFNNVWMVQLGTFSDAENAYRLRDKLRKDGFDAHTKPIEVKGKSAIRVFTGPFVNKRDAERAKQKVDGKYKVDSLLVFFEP